MWNNGRCALWSLCLDLSKHLEKKKSFRDRVKLASLHQCFSVKSTFLKQCLKVLKLCEELRALERTLSSLIKFCTVLFSFWFKVATFFACYLFDLWHFRWKLRALFLWQFFRLWIWIHHTMFSFFTWEEAGSSGNSSVVVHLAGSNLSHHWLFVWALGRKKCFLPGLRVVLVHILFRWILRLMCKRNRLFSMFWEKDDQVVSAASEVSYGDGLLVNTPDKNFLFMHSSESWLACVWKVSIMTCLDFCTGYHIKGGFDNG